MEKYIDTHNVKIRDSIHHNFKFGTKTNWKPVKLRFPIFSLYVVHSLDLMREKIIFIFIKKAI